jgi:hypothetical protein
MRVASLLSGLLATALLGVAASAHSAWAQSIPRGFVTVAAHDSAGAPIAAAEVTVTRGLKDVVAHGMTNGDGHTVLSFDAKDSVDLQVTVRKIGYPRSDYFFAAGPRDTALVQVVVAKSKGTMLDAVKVIAPSDPKYKSYHLDADDIAAATVPLFDGWDVVKRLRPDMLTSRGGCATGIQNVWVNGKRIVLPLPATGITAATARVGVPRRARFTYAAVSVLADIPPEHIQELTYRDCMDQSMAMIGTTDALFIVLKPGIGYQRDVGSFVDESYGRPAPDHK